MAGNFQCPQGQICSDAYGTAVGSRNTNLFVRTSTAIQQGSGTQVTGGTTTLYSWVPDTTSGLTYGTGQGNWQPAARSTDGKTWTLLKDSKGQNVLGTDAANSLLSPTGNLNKNVSANTTKTLQQKGGLTTQQSQAVVKTNAGVGTATAGAGTTATPVQTQEDLQKGIEGKDVRVSYRKDLSYPLNRNQKQDYIRFDLLEYSPKKIESNLISSFSEGASVDEALGKSVFGDRATNRSVIGSVSLPISSPISDTNTVNWSDQSIDAMQAQAQALALQLIGGASSPSTTPAQPDPSGSSTPTTGSANTQKLVGYSLASKAAGGNANLFTRATGAIVNPNLELLFNGPSLRTFSFTFPLVARSQKESEVILQIIRLFKQGMSVKRAKSSLFLKSPHTFRIKYVYAKDKNHKDHPWLNKFKECALTNCSVNYTPAGNYATYANGAMTMYEITLNFSELEPIFDDDYAKLGDGDGNSAGKDKVIGY